MDKKKHYLVYKTTNLVNGKIYIGKHETNNLDDGYLGSGILIRRAIEKYGEENFTREILFECSSQEEMNAKEAELVNEEFLKCDDIYNIKLGGKGGFDFINNNSEIKSNANFTKWNSLPKQKRCAICKKISNKLKRVWKEHPEKFKNIHRINPISFKGKHHTDETKQKMREKAHLRVGEKNSSFGTVWIYNENLG